jgi:hypothetical protein
MRAHARSVPQTQTVQLIRLCSNPPTRLPRPPSQPPRRRSDRSPPHRGRYDERDRDDHYHRGGPPPYDGYGQPPPPPREPRGPLSFRQFLNKLSDDVSPEEAQR